jgi:hypothetical protein
MKVGRASGGVGIYALRLYNISLLDIGRCLIRVQRSISGVRLAAFDNSVR